MTITINIFIIDDDVSILNLYSKFIEFLGHNIVDYANNGEEAIAKFQKFRIKPDLIIMDHHMPIKNGIESMKEILKIDKEAKIIIASGDSTIRETALLNGAVDFKEKPFDFKLFNSKIKNNVLFEDTK